MTPRGISIVIPAWNEERRIGRSLDLLLVIGPPLGIDEVIVVSDGSNDRTTDIVRAHMGEPEGPTELILVEHERHRGKGAALRAGLLAASSPLVGYLDADLSIGPASFREARALIEAGADVVVGYRISYTGMMDGKGQPLLRRMLSIGFRIVQRSIVGLRVRDTQCPFKLFTRAAAQRIVPACRMDGWAFDVEVLVAASGAGLRIAELPVNWAFAGGSTVRADLPTMWRTARDLLRIRFSRGRRAR